MDSGCNWNVRSSLVYLTVLSVIFGSASCYAGSLPDSKAPFSNSNPKTVVRNGYTIEIFETAQDQLRYARAWFSDPLEKQAALEVLIAQYPQPADVRAEAELELAYLALGGDYRFAGERACRNALRQYERIAAQFSDLPDIAAKAHWYMGWIYADLLRQKKDALAHYHIIVARYPDAVLKLEPPVPWVSLVLPRNADRPPAVYESPVYPWRSMALLEIIRNSDDDEEKWTAFERLWARDQVGTITGHALLALLRGSPTLGQRASGPARIYLQTQPAGRSLAKEMRTVLPPASQNDTGRPPSSGHQGAP